MIRNLVMNSVNTGIELVGYATGSSDGGTSISLTSLTGGVGSYPIQNDIVIVVAAENTVSTSPLVSTSGYTQHAIAQGNDSEDALLQVHYKVMGVSPDTSVTLASLGGGAESAIVFVWRGVKTSSPFDTTASTNGSSGTAIPAGTGNKTTNTNAAVIMCAGAGGHSKTTYPTITSSGLDAEVQNTGTLDSVGHNISLTAGYKATTSAGSYATATYTFDASDSTSYSSASVTFVLKPN